MTNLALVFPEIFLSLSIMFLLILGVFKKNSSKLIQNISLIILLITSVITLNETLGIQETLLFNSSVVIDYLSSFMKIVTLLAAFLVLPGYNFTMSPFSTCTGCGTCISLAKFICSIICLCSP